MVILDRKARKEIVQAIAEAERLTSGEIRVHIQKKCKGGAFEQAKKVFYKLRMHKTKLRNSVLIFVAVEAKELAIVGDRAIHETVGDAFWQNTRDLMLEYFKQDKPKEGIIEAALKTGEKLREFFPRASDDRNELSNKVTKD